MSEIPLDQAPVDVAAAAHDAARGKVVYLTEHGQRLAAIIPSDLAAGLENLTPEAFRGLLEDFADALAAQGALAEIEEGASPVPAERVWAELRLDSCPPGGMRQVSLSRPTWVAPPPGAVAALALD